MNNKFLGVSLLVTLLGGCAAKPGETFDSKFAFDHQSMANDMVWLAGYTGLMYRTLSGKRINNTV